MPAAKDPEQRRRNAEAQRQRQLGKKRNLSPEARAAMGRKISAAKKGKARPDMRGNRNPMRRPDVAKKVSEAQKGRPVPEERRARIAETLRGRTYPIGWGRSKKAGYAAAHDRLIRERGHACDHDCEVCGCPGKHWALSHEAPMIEIDGNRKRYSLDATDYVVMCVRCHKRYDRGTLHI